jgi:16S rRNA pseudouridine516 synthase
VAELHRLSIGEYRLPTDLAEGEWRWLYPDDLMQLSVSLAES